ncbi:hypothetical protein AAGR22_04070 [Erwinia sp. HDF1-3R]|uniref:hypothetical protein n=1 Tax=Erwinia sp. HDF1-3R TaxID=3141543 RepID=UPI0031F4CC1E
MLHSGSGGQGCPLVTGPSGLASEPKAPRGAWREDARQTLGLSTDTAAMAAQTTNRQPLGLSSGTAVSQPIQLISERWDCPRNNEYCGSPVTLQGANGWHKKSTLLT